MEIGSTGYASYPRHGLVVGGLGINGPEIVICTADVFSGANGSHHRMVLIVVLAIFYSADL
jgi:hypothetical protein